MLPYPSPRMLDDADMTNFRVLLHKAMGLLICGDANNEVLEKRVWIGDILPPRVPI